MKTNLFLIAAATLMVTSCSKESVVDSEVNEASNAIAFTSYTNITKGTPISSNGEFTTEGKNFGVTAFLNGTGTTTGATFIHMGFAEKGAEVSYSGGWNVVNTAQPAFWPTGADNSLDFYAYSPFGNKAITQKFVYQKGITLDYTVPTVYEEQVDLMYAKNLEQKKPTNSNVVNLPFEHALTQVLFGIATKTDRLKIEVAANGLVINKIMSQGTFDTEAKSWTNLGNSQNFMVTSAVKTFGYIGTTPKYTLVGDNAEGATSNALMMLPQTFVGTTLNGEGVVGTDGSYLTISCKIYQVDATGTQKNYIIGAADLFESIDVPISSSAMINGTATEVWARNNKVTYNLLIGEGIAGVLDPIEFTTSVVDWSTGDEVVIGDK